MKQKDGVYYDTKHDYLVVLFFMGNRFYIEAEFDDCTLTGKSKPNGDPEKANLIYIGAM